LVQAAHRRSRSPQGRRRQRRDDVVAGVVSRVLLIARVGNGIQRGAGVQRLRQVL
jgi:hypothetical protein